MTKSSLAVNEQVIGFGFTRCSMRGTAKRLKIAREAAGYLTPTDAARAMGVPPPTYLGHENGTTEFPHAAPRYAQFFRVSLDWLLMAKGPSGIHQRVPVVMYIGAGAELFPMDDHAKGGGLEMVAPPPGVNGPCVAAKIRGDSMHPLRDGWLVFWVKDQEGVPQGCIGQVCVCQVKNGPTLLKELTRGSKPGLYTLTSWNAPPRFDVELEWASKIIDIRMT